jgi:Helix-turn-helix
VSGVWVARPEGLRRAWLAYTPVADSGRATRRLHTLSIILYENEKRCPKLKTAIRLAAALNVSLDELAGVDDAAKERDGPAHEFGPTSRLL